MQANKKKSDEQVYPRLGFYFKVSVGTMEFSFQTVSGLNFEVVTESYRAGGMNYDYELPVKHKYADLILKRGLFIPKDAKPGDSVEETVKQAMKALEQIKLNRLNITISLQKDEKNPLMVWEVHNAWLKKWSLSELNAQESRVVIETMEFNYDYFEKKST